MKKSAIMLCLAASIGLGGQAAIAEETAAGCGVGKMLMEGKSGKGANIAAAIVNQILFQTFFMSTAATMGEEMLGCDPTQTVMKDEHKKAFVAVNMDSLSRDMAKGSGDYLTALADLMGIEDQDKPAFYSMAQQEYTALAPTGADASGLLAGLNTAMATRPDLAKYIR